MNDTQNEHVMTTESFDIKTAVNKLAESEKAIAEGIALLRKTAIANNLQKMEPTLDMIQTEIKGVKMYAQIFGKMTGTPLR